MNYLASLFALLGLVAMFPVHVLTYGSRRISQEGSWCRLTNGSPGLCRGLDSCPVVRLYMHRRAPNYCPTHRQAPVVCCPLSVPTFFLDPSNIVPSPPRRPSRPHPPLPPHLGPTPPTPKPLLPPPPPPGPTLPTPKPLLPQPVVDISPPPVDFECGKSLLADRRSRRKRQTTDSSLLTISINATRFEWPWMALLGQREGREVDWFCSGVLINRRWVLTAAHCFERTINVVRLGEWDYSDNISDGEDYGIAATVYHHEYQDPLAYHDLALVRLERDVVFSIKIRPLCLAWGKASEEQLLGRGLTLAGWGYTQDGGRASPLLQVVNVTVFPSSRCVEGYSTLPHYRTLWPNGIGQESICAGDAKGEGRDACNADSGGPAMYRGADGGYTLAGIISRGNGCGLERFPGLYVNMHQHQYLAFVKSVAFTP